MNEGHGQLHTLSVLEQLREASKERAFGAQARERISASTNFCDS
jgi:hypothetical protein